ncbi:MAG: phospho-N-acetylmuramoyl-pentapeptide-transferase [Oscillospiraceae bacterium]|nr:phospho-N-acetylmuramoyl-pentapeptide-transferase [Oscillospiraceae bacterium]
MIWAFALSLAVTALAGLPLLPLLRRLGVGQSIREIGPHWHASKSGTPTIGGLMIILGTTVTILVLGPIFVHPRELNHYLVLGFAWIYGIIGFADDFLKVTRRQNKGLGALPKFILQLVAAAAMLVLMHHFGDVAPTLYIPFFKVNIDVVWFVFLIPAIICTTGFVNAVNLTDGLDGLCSGVTLPVALFFAVLCYYGGSPAATLSAAALAGGVAGFLLYNFHPARVFMGDTGSLFLGGFLCGLAFASGKPLLLIPVGLVYLVEMLSVIMQVLYFKATKGKRIFRMSPLHHHFEMGGWGEVKIFFVFSILTTAICLFMLAIENYI